MADDGPADFDYIEGRHTPLKPGAAGGLAAFAAGYLLTYAVARDAGQSTLVREATGALSAEPAAWKAVAWVFYNAHFVATNVGRADGAVVTQSLIGAGTPVLYVVAPVLLVAAGYVAADHAPISEPKDALKSGASVWPGYFAPVVAIALLSRSGTPEVFAGPDPVLSIIVAGIVYPAVFGCGGAVLQVLRDG